jgi:hypothetical protein
MPRCLPDPDLHPILFYYICHCSFYQCLIIVQLFYSFNFHLSFTHDMPLHFIHYLYKFVSTYIHILYIEKGSSLVQFHCRESSSYLSHSFQLFSFFFLSHRPKSRARIELDNKFMGKNLFSLYNISACLVWSKLCHGILVYTTIYYLFIVFERTIYIINNIKWFLIFYLFVVICRVDNVYDLKLIMSIVHLITSQDGLV